MPGPDPFAVYVEHCRLRLPANPHLWATRVFDGRRVGLVTDLHGLAKSSFADRAGVDIVQAEHRLTDWGITPANQERVWATTPPVCPISVFRAVTARRNRPLRCPVAVCNAPLAVRITAVASRMVCSATPAQDP